MDFGKHIIGYVASYVVVILNIFCEIKCIVY